MNSNDLTIEEQKLLTEFLSECWHDYQWVSGKYLSGMCWSCASCNNQPDLRHGTLRPVNRLDFSDWRVVGRLVEKITSNTKLGISYNHTKAMIFDDGFQAWYGKGETPQLAICRAVLAYLKEKE